MMNDEGLGEAMGRSYEQDRRKELEKRISVLEQKIDHSGHLRALLFHIARQINLHHGEIENGNRENGLLSLKGLADVLMLQSGVNPPKDH